MKPHFKALLSGLQGNFDTGISFSPGAHGTNLGEALRHDIRRVLENYLAGRV